MQSPHMHSVLTPAEVRRVMTTAVNRGIPKSALKNLDPNGFSVFSIRLPYTASGLHHVFMQLKMRGITEPLTGYADIPVRAWESLRQPAEVTADTHDENEDWKQFQVNYPETSYADFEIIVYNIEPRNQYRIDTITRQGDERDPGSGTFRKLIENQENKNILWMSDTRAEILEHTPILERLGNAETVLVNGLGLGVIANAAAQFPNMKRVDVVEINHDIVELISPQITDPRIHIREGDAYTVQWPEDQRWDLAWHDIWPMISDENIPEMRRLMKKYQGKTGWQGCWQYQGSLKMYEMIQRMENGTLDPEEALQYVLGYWKPND